MLIKREREGKRESARDAERGGPALEGALIEVEKRLARHLRQLLIYMVPLYSYSYSFIYLYVYICMCV